MTAYLTTLLAQMSVIYERDVQVHLTINRLQAWTTTDPYSATGPARPAGRGRRLVAREPAEGLLSADSRVSS